MFYGKNVGVIPLTDAAGITKPFNWPSHKGVDIGWSDARWINCAVLAWQDGFVVDKGYGSEVGYYIVLEHTYDDGTKRWTGYIHLSTSSTLLKGQKVELGQCIGYRGNSGKSNGVHLHLYLTDTVTVKTLYTWDTMLAHSIDPVPYLYFSAKYNTIYIAPTWKKELKEMKYPKPVERNELVEQCDIKSDTRRMRNQPSTSGKAYDQYCTKGIYNVHGWTSADGYDWTMIDEIDGNKFYVAVMEGEDLPVVDYKSLYQEELDKNKVLEDKLKQIHSISEI